MSKARRRLFPAVFLATGLLALGGLTLYALPPAIGQESPEGGSVSGSKQVELVVGAQKVISTSYGIGDISIGNSQCVSFTPFRDRREILLHGLRPGVSSLIIFDTRGNRREQYDIQVLSENLQRLINNIKGMLGDIEGLRFRVVGDKIIIEGEVLLEEEKRRVESIAERYNNVMQFVTLSPVTQRIMANTIEKEIARPDISVRPLRNQILLEGIVYSETAKLRAEAIARAYYNNIVNVLEVRQSDRPPSKEKTIVIIAHYVSLAKSLLDSWGVEWAPLNFISGGGTGGGLSAVDATMAATYDLVSGELAIDPIELSSTVQGLLPKLRRAKSAGYVRVLENPTVSVKSGEQVVMFSGMQYPYPVQTNMGMTIEWKEIGAKLDALPYAQGDSVDMKLKIEITELGQISNANGDPAIDMSRIETRQFCKAGESIVIGGMARLSDSVVYNRAPEESGALIQLAKNKSYSKGKSQFLVFLTPQIHETSSTANKEIQEKFNLKEVKQ